MFFSPAKDDRKQRSIAGTFSERLNNRNRLQGFRSRVATNLGDGSHILFK
jgi:ribosomal protein L34